ncbi:hypothetical protein J1D01_11690 [Seonamhaeicola sp. NFXS20]|uniref:hypothetical protein n=1 Tax=Seonamhaeicola sp. NFXS20 TaxID=2816959 RepID=UPI003B8B056E
MKIKNFLKHLNNIDAVKNTDSVLNMVLQMLLLIFLMFMHDNGYLSIFTPVVIVPAILFKELRENKYIWSVLSVFGVIFYLILDLQGYVPNHKHIFAYVILMVTLSLFFKNKSTTIDFLKTQSKYIIGLCFLFAVIGKFLAPEFLNGSFFEFTNTSDPRFFGFSSIIGEIDMGLLKQNEQNFNALLNTTNPKESFILNGADKISSFGIIISYWTIFIEGMIAISFCLPKRFLLAKYRNVFLVTFILTTYPIATVTGFAIILTTLGFIQSLNKENQLSIFSWFYLLVFILMPLNYFPFTRLLSLF